MSESMATGWYYLDGATGIDRQVGPLNWEQLYRLAYSGTLQPAHLVWHPALPQWTPAAQIQGLVPVPPPVAAPPSATAVPAYAPTPGYTPGYAPGCTPGYSPDCAPGYAPAMAQGGERILAVAGNLVQAGGFMGMTQQVYSLIFTDYRIIFAQMTRERTSAFIEQARDDAKAQGKGFFGQWGAQLGVSSRLHEVYRQMSPDAALAETPGNFAIDRATIEKVRFERGGIDNDNRSQPDYVILKTSAGKFRLRVGGSLSEVRGAFSDAGIC